MCDVYLGRQTRLYAASRRCLNGRGRENKQGYRPCGTPHNFISQEKASYHLVVDEIGKLCSNSNSNSNGNSGGDKNED